MRHYLKKLSNWLLPYSCILCSNNSGRYQDLCEQCLQTLPVPTTCCQKCALPLFATQSTDLCGECLKHPPAYDRIHALYLYQMPLPKLILELKFNHALVIANVLGELMADKIENTWYKNKPLPDLIIPIPLHRKRLKERGFNQALEIARPIAKAIQRPLNLTGCQRIKPTEPQATLPAEKRKMNIKEAFVIKHDFKGLRVAILDDVLTTGNTINEFCKTLKQQGVATMDVWCCARSFLS